MASRRNGSPHMTFPMPVQTHWRSTRQASCTHSTETVVSKSQHLHDNDRRRVRRRWRPTYKEQLQQQRQQVEKVSCNNNSGGGGGGGVGGNMTSTRLVLLVAMAAVRPPVLVRVTIIIRKA